VESERFDGWVRALTARRSRRGALVELLGGGLGLAGVTAVEAKKHKKKKGGSPPASPPGSPPVAPPPSTASCPASCPVCQACVDGRSCTVQPNRTPCGNGGCRECQGGVCVSVPDETRCQGAGLCRDGLCNQPPDCLSIDSAPCGADAPCCNGTCDPIDFIPTCQGQGEAGAPCHVDFDCLTGTCVAFRCQ
jgi:hypothetical protein